MSFDHPLRRPLSDVLHERSLQIFRTPVALRSWVYLVDDADREAETKWIAALSDPETAQHGRLAHTEAVDGRVRSGCVWERHGEFSTYLQFSHDVGSAGRDLGFGRFRSDAFGWLNGAPGRRFRSVEIVVSPHQPATSHLQDFINVEQAVCCDVFDGAARLWSDFRLHEAHDDDEDGGGAGRIYVHDKGLQNDEVSRLLQSLLEIGHYRKLALLGFPPARELFAWLKLAEGKLEIITQDMTQAGFAQQRVLESLMSLSAEVEAQVNAVRFRQGATEAYYRLTQDRLVSLREARVKGFSTMGEFIQRRLQPAMRTCEAANGRLDDLSVRLGRVSDLLRAKISISLERQNQDLLKSMDTRSRLQLRMQSLVEGLSVFAISYYVFSLLKYLIEPLAPGHGANTAWIYALVIVLTLAVVWLFIHYRKKAIGHED